ncbi:MAG: hypothetical protein Q7R43_00365 [Candidatus Daviesbacteria bacterium]|nr:hypothetical protein [Candidatus Daviesbacteria bacterium]
MKFITTLTIVLLFIFLSVPVLAEKSATSSVTKNQELKKPEKIEDNIETKINKLEPKKKDSVLRLRNTVTVRYGVYEKLIEKSGNLLTKLQEKIDVAQKAGFNTKVADGYMTDAKAKLDDAKLTLDSIKTLQGTAIDKATFQSIQKKFIIIHKDLNAVRQDGAKVISELKRFNAVTPKVTPKLTPKPTKSATSSAEKS